MGGGVATVVRRTSINPNWAAHYLREGLEILAPWGQNWDDFGGGGGWGASAVRGRGGVKNTKKAGVWRFAKGRLFGLPLRRSGY
jgi:hypothetical protein